MIGWLTRMVRGWNVKLEDDNARKAMRVERRRAWLHYRNDVLRRRETRHDLNAHVRGGGLGRYADGCPKCEHEPWARVAEPKQTGGTEET